MSATLEPLSRDEAAARRFAARAIGVRVHGGRESPDWAREFERRLAAGSVNARLYVAEGRAVGLASWSPAGPVGASVHLVYLSTEGADPGRYGAVLDAVERVAGALAFVSGPFAGLSVAEEDAVMHPRGFRRFGRSELVLADGELPAEPAVGPGETLRTFVPADLAGLAELHRAAYHGTFDRYLFLESWDEAEDARLAVTEIVDGRWGRFDPRGSWVLERDGRPAGAVLSLRTPAGALVADVAVARELQGRGVGRRVLARAVRALREDDGGKIYLNVTEGNAPALRLYARLGFVRSLGPTRDWYNAALIPVGPAPDG